MARDLLVVCNAQIKMVCAAIFRTIGFNFDLLAMPRAPNGVMSDEFVKVNFVITQPLDLQ